MNIRSACCHKPVVSSTKLHYPLGGRTYYESFKVDVCECCGMEVEDYVEECEECGEVACGGHV